MAGISINFVEVELTSDNISMHSLKADGKSIKTYREENGNDFYFYNNQILYWSKNKNVQNYLNGSSITVSKQEHPNVFSKVIENALADFFINLRTRNGESVYRFRKNQHHNIWEFVSGKNEVEGELDGIEINRKISLHPLTLNQKIKSLPVSRYRLVDAQNNLLF